MRQARSLVFVLGLLAACEPNAKIDPVTVQWMDWPAEVNAGQPFRTRLVVWGVCAINPQLRAGASADQSAVAFAPYFLVGNDHIECLTARTRALLAVIAIDTAGTAPGLAALSARSYEMRAPTLAFALSAGAQNLAVSKFGGVVVRRSGADASRRHAAGHVNIQRASLNYPGVRPIGLFTPHAALGLQHQADYAGFFAACVSGHIHHP